MIQVDRSKVTAPASLRSAAVGLALERASATCRARRRLCCKPASGSIRSCSMPRSWRPCRRSSGPSARIASSRHRPRNRSLSARTWRAGPVRRCLPAHYLVVGVPVETTSTSPARNAVVAREIAFRSLLTPCAWRQGGSSTTVSLAAGFVRRRTRAGFELLRRPRTRPQRARCCHYRDRRAAPERFGRPAASRAERIASCSGSIREPSMSAGKPTPPSTHLRALQRAIAPDVPFSQSQRQCAARLLRPTMQARSPKSRYGRRPRCPRAGGRAQPPGQHRILRARRRRVRFALRLPAHH